MGFIFPIKFNSPQIQVSIDFRCNQKTNIPKLKQDPLVSQKWNAPDEHIVNRPMLSNRHHKNWVSTSGYVVLFLVLISPTLFFWG